MTASPEDWAKLLPYIEDLDLRKRGFFKSAYYLGARPSELLGMRPAHLFFLLLLGLWLLIHDGQNALHL